MLTCVLFRVVADGHVLRNWCMGLVHVVPQMYGKPYTQCCVLITLTVLTRAFC